MSRERDEAEERIVSNGGQYGSVEASHTTNGANLPPKPAVRQRTTASKQNNNNNSSQINQQDLCDGQSRKSSSSSGGGSGSGSGATRDELNRELQAELSRKLSLARSRLEQSEQLEKQIKANNNDDPHEQHQQQPPSKSADLSLSMSMEKPARLRRLDNQQVSCPEIGDLPPTRPYPKKVFFIIANEFCERFSYYGLRTVLVMYLTRALNFSESNSTITFHLFATLCYVTPILGAILGDSIIGKFKTILYLSIVYFLGELTLMMSSVFWNHGSATILGTFAGLFLIGFGTGGIKPCVSALGGDQFMAHEEKWRQSFFSLFYAAINAGSLITVFVTPLLRTEFHCVGRQDCFPYAFGLPCILMFLAIVVFLLAKNQYYLAPLPEENVIVSFCKCIWVAAKRKLTGARPQFVLDDNLATLASHSSSSSSPHSSGSETSSHHDETLVSSSAQSSSTHLAPGAASSKHHMEAGGRPTEDDSKRRSHWLYLAADRFDSKSIEAFRSVLGILLLFIPTLVYWCLFDQQGSLWTLQATRMDGHIFGGQFVLQPDQMGVANPLILLAIIPVFEVFIYPCLGRCQLMRKPLQRMTMGGFIASLAFLSSAAIEVRIQQFLPPSEPQMGSANLILVNGLRECSLINATISHTHMPSSDINLTSADVTDASNQSMAADTLALGSIEALTVSQPVSVKSAANRWTTSALGGYQQLKLRLADSPEQIRANRSFGCPLGSTTDAAASREHEFGFAPLPDRTTRLLYVELGNGKLTYRLFNESLELPASNKARVRLLYEFFGSSSQAMGRQFSLLAASSQHPADWATINATKPAGQQQQQQQQQPGGGKIMTFVNSLRDGQVLLSDYLDIEVPISGSLFSLKTNDNKLAWSSAPTVQLEPGTRNLLIVHQSDANHVWLKQQVLQDNKYRINMLYQLIPYTLISMSEVMFSITGLEFSYSMAPASMKSVLLAIWSLTIAFGNLLTVFVESLHLFTDVAYEFMFYAGLMAVDMCLFAVMGYNFKPNKYHGQ